MKDYHCFFVLVSCLFVLVPCLFVLVSCLFVLVSCLFVLVSCLFVLVPCLFFGRNVDITFCLKFCLFFHIKYCPCFVSQVRSTASLATISVLCAAATSFIPLPLPFILWCSLLFVATIFCPVSSCSLLLPLSYFIVGLAYSHLSTSSFVLFLKIYIFCFEIILEVNCSH